MFRIHLTGVQSALHCGAVFWNQSSSRQSQEGTIYNDYEEQLGCLVQTSRFQCVQGNENPPKSGRVNSRSGPEKLSGFINRANRWSWAASYGGIRRICQSLELKFYRHPLNASENLSPKHKIRIRDRFSKVSELWPCCAQFPPMSTLTFSKLIPHIFK